MRWFPLPCVTRLCLARNQVGAIRDATGLVLGCRRQKRYDQAALDAAAKLLKVVPEVSGHRPGWRGARGSGAQPADQGLSLFTETFSWPRAFLWGPPPRRSTLCGTTGGRRCSQCLKRAGRRRPPPTTESWR